METILPYMVPLLLWLNQVVVGRIYYQYSKGIVLGNMIPIGVNRNHIAQYGSPVALVELLRFVAFIGNGNDMAQYGSSACP